MVMIDLPGLAIKDYYEQNRSSRLYVHDRFGPKVLMPVSLYFRSFAQMPELEQLAVRSSKGSVLDIGAGAGSHALELQERGLDVCALEISESGCKVMRDRGVREVVCADFFSFSGRKYDTLLLLMNGIGLCSDLQGFGVFLEKAKELLKTGGQIIFDSCDIKYMYEEFILPSNYYYGEVECSYQYGSLRSAWFKWLYIDYNTMQKIACSKGFESEQLAKDSNHQYLARLTLSAL